MSKRIELIGNKLNKCATFVLPMCEINYNTLPNNFINSYLQFDKGKDNYQVIIIFEKFNDQYSNTNIRKIEFDNFIDYIEGNRNYAGKEEEGEELLLYFNIPDRNKRNYELFLAGKYSGFSDEYKKLLLSYYGSVSRKSDYRVNECDVINPTAYKRKQVAEWLFSPQEVDEGLKLIVEVLDSPDIEKEKYKSLEQIIETNQKDKSI